jgi:hypothetical protein
MHELILSKPAIFFKAKTGKAVAGADEDAECGLFSVKSATAISHDFYQRFSFKDLA